MDFHSSHEKTLRGYDESIAPRILLLRREEKEFMSIFFTKKNFNTLYEMYLLSDENRWIYSNYRLLYLIITIEKYFK